MSDTRVRSSLVGVVVLALFSALFARLWYLQVASTEQFSAAASSNSVREIVEPPVRGRILDAQGRVLVDNRVGNRITVDRKLSVAQRKKVLERLAPTLKVPFKTLDARAGDPRISPYTAVPVAYDVDFATLAYVSEHRREFPGVRAEATPVREYPNKNLGAHVLGYLGEINPTELKAQVDPTQYQLGDKIGKSGVELTYESDLRGKPGFRQVEVDATGRVLRTLKNRRSTPGDDVRLTLNIDVQHAAETALFQGIAAARESQDFANRDSFTKLKATAGSAIVLDAATGSVVAMASQPDFDPNQFVDGIPQSTWEFFRAKENNLPLVNRAVAGQYFPGSTFKLVTAVAGLNSGVVNASTTFNDTGEYRYPSDPTHPFRGETSNGKVALSRALTVSSDPYFYKIGGDLFFRQKKGQPGGDAIQSAARDFGFGQPTGIALPTEGSGLIADAAWTKQMHETDPKNFPFADWLPGDNIQSAIGQKDILVTPIQMATAYEALANGGTRYSPRLADEVRDVTGKLVRSLDPITSGTLVIPERATLMSGFAGVIEDPKGTAVQAFAGFPKGLAAGKTGTAQVAGKQNTSWFVGMTPAENPKYIVLAVVEEGGYGAQTAAPIVRAIMDHLNGLPPTPVVNIAQRTKG